MRKTTPRRATRRKLAARQQDQRRLARFYAEQRAVVTDSTTIADPASAPE